MESGIGALHCYDNNHIANEDAILSTLLVMEVSSRYLLDGL